MRLQLPLAPRAIAAWPLLFAAILLACGEATAQGEATPENQKTPETWEELRFFGVPEGFSTDEISLFHGLNESRGSWSFVGEVIEGKTSKPIAGRLNVAGSFLPASYTLSLEWPAEDSRPAITYSIVPTFEPTGFKFMLSRGVKPEPGARPQAGEIFLGEWDLERRTIVWNESNPFGLVGFQDSGQPQSTENDAPRPMKSFEMRVGINGEITILNDNNTADRPAIIGRTQTRIDEPKVETKLGTENLGTKQLPNGYSIFYANAFHNMFSQVCLVNKAMRVEAGARVTKLGTEGHFIYGLVEKNGDEEEGPKKPGYFLIDSSTGEKQLGLSLDAWHAALKAVGIDEPAITMVQSFGPTSIGCDSPANRKQGQLSPSGNYVLAVPRHYQNKTKESVWMVTIKSNDGSLLYEDRDSTFFGGLNVYFGWDHQDRVWLYNSDDRSIWRWERAGSDWRKLPSSREEGMPEWILPEYEKSTR